MVFGGGGGVEMGLGNPLTSPVGSIGPRTPEGQGPCLMGISLIHSCFDRFSRGGVKMGLGNPLTSPASLMYVPAGVGRVRRGQGRLPALVQRLQVGNGPVGGWAHRDCLLVSHPRGLWGLFVCCGWAFLSCRRGLSGLLPVGSSAPECAGQPRPLVDVRCRTHAHTGSWCRTC